jgi:hypothetical protein
MVLLPITKFSQSIIKECIERRLNRVRYYSLTKINIQDLPLSGKLQSHLIQLEHRTPGVGVENGITPCRLSACSMLSSVEATLVGGLLPLFSQYRTERG